VAGVEPCESVLQKRTSAPSFRLQLRRRWDAEVRVGTRWYALAVTLQRKRRSSSSGTLWRMSPSLYTGLVCSRRSPLHSRVGVCPRCIAPSGPVGRVAISRPVCLTGGPCSPWPRQCLKRALVGSESGAVVVFAVDRSRDVNDSVGALSSAQPVPIHPTFRSEIGLSARHARAASLVVLELTQPRSVHALW
jgi:hypothetical protein